MAGAFDMDDLDDLEQEDLQDMSVVNRVASSVLYFEPAARKNVSWYHPDEKAWLREKDDNWKGWSSAAAPHEVASDWTPWTKIFDDGDAPFYTWCSGALSNAAFNEVDVHILEGDGEQLAYIEEADPSQKGDKSGQITRHELFVKSAMAAKVLRSHGLATGDRVLFSLPAGIEQIVWVEACKRLGVIYCCCNPGLPPEQIADRIYVLQAKFVISCEHPDWSYVVHKALNDYVPVGDALKLASKIPNCDPDQLATQWSSRFTVSVNDTPFKEHGSFLEGPLKNDRQVLLGTQILILDAVRVPVNFIQQQMRKPESKADAHVVKDLSIEDALDKELKGPDAVAKIWADYGAPVPVEANFPLFVIFTSGTTGKPKGVCHTHTYVVGLVETMKVVFDAKPQADIMLTIGALGWITGQSYQISAPLASGVTAVLMRGNPVRPKRWRFAEVINKHSVTIFKAGSAFLREVMSDKESMEEVRNHHTEKVLKIATFCAEPVSSAVQQFAMDAICPNYINSYWATEHGGIAWSRRYKDSSQVLKADTHSWPLPWVDCDVLIFDQTSRPKDESEAWKARSADVGEQGEIVLTAPYPYMFRYVWGDVSNLMKPDWTGDRNVMTQKYWRKAQLPDSDESWVYVQGDFAVKHSDGAFTFHGRSDEVLNVNGILYGTEHIEGAILRDKQNVKDSFVGHCVVVGYPDKIAGEVPLAFIVPSNKDEPVKEGDYLRLYGLVNSVIGAVQVKFVLVSELPQTFSGKFMRRLLKSIACNEPLGDTSTISNPACIDTIKEEFAKWSKQQKTA